MVAEVIYLVVGKGIFAHEKWATRHAILSRNDSTPCEYEYYEKDFLVVIYVTSHKLPHLYCTNVACQISNYWFV